MRPYLLVLLAACGSDVEGRLAARRAALGLANGPIPFADAMKGIEAKAYEALLARAGAKRLPADELLDAALDIENLLVRADASTAAARPPNPLDFDSKLKESRERALALARAVARGGTGEPEARALVDSCVHCHITFRTPR
jgi:hypothetical protein